MRYFIILSFVAGVFLSCKKDKFSSEPQITYKSLKGNFYDATVTGGNFAYPSINFNITDAEGDIDTDSARIYIKNLKYNTMDSLQFPNLASAKSKNFKAEVNASVEKITKSPGGTGGTIIILDTIFYEIYVRDQAKNKSNVIKTSDPVYFRHR